MILAAVLAAGVVTAPMPPQDDTNSGTPPWATEAWQDFAAHIVASEARGVPQADKVVACMLVRDIERGWHPWALRGRWFGWGTPDARDRRAVADALQDCSDVPDYRYVGNVRDVHLWRSRGMVGPGPLDLYVGRGGQTVVGVPW